MRQGKSSCKINDEISLEISYSNFTRVHNKLTPAENPRARSDKSGAELHGNVEEVKDVGERTIDGNFTGGFVISGHTSSFADERYVEVKWIDEKRDETGKEEDIVPAIDNIAVWVENLAPPWHISRR